MADIGLQAIECHEELALSLSDLPETGGVGEGRASSLS
jgi:hypothetical protein